MHGVEFISALTALTTANSNPNLPGDVMFAIPLGPLFMPGTELYKESQGWEQYSFKSVNMHYMPSCPSTTNGAMVSWWEPDLERPTFGVITDQNTRIREALARENALMFHPFKEVKITCPKLALEREQYYNVMIDDEVEETVPAMFYIICESKFTDPNSQTTMSVGQLMLDYEIEFYDRSLIDVPVAPGSGTVSVSSTGTNLYGSVSINQPVSFQNTQLGSMNLLNSQFAIIITQKSLIDSSASTSVSVSHHGVNGNFNACQEGQILFGYTNGNSTNVYVSPNIEDAILKNYTSGGLVLAAALTGADTFTWTFAYVVYDLSGSL